MNTAPRKTYVRAAADGLLALAKVAGQTTVTGLVNSVLKALGV